MAEDKSKEVEVIEDNRLEVLPNAMVAALDDYIIENGNIDTVKDLTQYRWKDALYYIHDRVFPVSTIFKDGDSEYDAFNFDILITVYESYKRLCAKHGKIVFLADFSILTGIDESTICQWGTQTRRKLTPAACKLWEKIMRDNESTVSTQMISSRQNPVGFMAILNHYHSWNMPGVKTSQIEQRRTPEQIAAAHGVESIGDNAQKILPSADFLRDENGEKNNPE